MCCLCDIATSVAVHSHMLDNLDGRCLILIEDTAHIKA
jgi:hypothetical protein